MHGCSRQVNLGQGLKGTKPPAPIKFRCTKRSNENSNKRKKSVRSIFLQDANNLIPKTSPRDLRSSIPQTMLYNTLSSIIRGIPLSISEHELPRPHACAGEIPETLKNSNPRGYGADIPSEIVSKHCVLKFYIALPRQCAKCATLGHKKKICRLIRSRYLKCGSEENCEGKCAQTRYVLCQMQPIAHV